MMYHHDKHLKAYIDKLNTILGSYPKYQKLSLEEILSNIYSFPENIRTDIRNNAGGVFNHMLYFDIINPIKVGKEPTNLINAISKQFGDISEFVKLFKENANKIFGSGYLFVVINKLNELEFILTKNQDSVFELNLYPIMLIDLWEHAYYLDYQNRRNDYIDNFVKIINLERVENRFVSYLEKNKEN